MSQQAKGQEHRLGKRAEAGHDRLESFNRVLKRAKPSGPFRKEQRGSGQEGQRGEQFEVFVGAVPFALSEKEVRDLFQDCGKVLGVKLLQNHEGKSKGRGYVKFADEEGVRKAVGLNGLLVQGQRLKVDVVKAFDDLYKEKWEKKEDRKFSKLSEANDEKGKFGMAESLSVVVRNLDQNVNQESFESAWKASEGFKSCRVITDGEGKNRGLIHPM